jgi:hypothetical protein
MVDELDKLDVPRLRRSEVFCMVTPPLRAGLTYVAPTGLGFWVSFDLRGRFALDAFVVRAV